MGLATDRVHQVHEIYVGRKQFYDIFAGLAVKRIDDMVVEINDIIKACHDLIEKRFVKMDNKKVWFDRDVAGIYPMLDQFEMPYFNAYYCKNLVVTHLDINHDNPRIIYDANEIFLSYEAEGFRFVVPTPREASTTFVVNNINDKDNHPYMQGDQITFIKSHNQAFFASDATVTSSGLRYYYTYGGNSYNNNYNIALIPIYRLNGVDSSVMHTAQTVYEWMKNGLIPQGLNDNVKINYERLMSAAKILAQYLDWENDSETVIFFKDKFKADVLSGKFKEKIFEYDFNLNATVEAVLSGSKLFLDSPDNLKQDLLLTDQWRIDLQPYTDEQVTDIRKGHWELFDMLQTAANGTGDQEQAVVSLPEGVIWAARPPQMDVHMNGVCSIDFGTKSTVVACMEQDTLLQRIGTNSFNKAVTMRDYENPTCIELRDLDGFMEAYREQPGRPFTKWEQITVSHQAAAALLGEDLDSSVYYSVFSELKQWANQKGRRLMLRDRCKGKTCELSPYLELGEDELDPIEIYAYYLGLAINNMYNGIYLNYIMSFPVNYGKNVRDKLLASFRKGLFKSLPMSLQQDEEFIQENFSVYAGASEPAAYAMVALKELNLEPKTAGETTAYGVFDFGGGTTDFDFGIESLPENRRRYRFQIEQFGQGGDVHLGGENILNVLAYEVYKKNLAQMRDKDITIALPSGCTKIAGVEGLVLAEREATQMAYMNRKCIAEKMRPIWERHPGYEKIFDAPLKVKLYSSGTTTDSTCELNIVKEDIEGIIRQLIEGGVDNFFEAWKTAFKDKEEMPVQILLAGNSCLSPVVKEVFNERLDKMENGKLFTLNMPLGMNTATDESNNQDIKDEQDVEPDIIGETFVAENEESNSSNESEDVSEEEMNFNRRITGKTGVVFGLLRSRRGGRDVKVINHNEDVTGEMTFPFYIGEIGENDTFEVIISREVDYGEWQPFCYADVNEIEIYFTSKPAAVNNTLTRREINMVKCKFSEDEVSESDDVQVYIRKVSPDTIEYAVGTKEEFDSVDELPDKIYKKILQEH